jgi:hypothetical protein
MLWLVFSGMLYVGVRLLFRIVGPQAPVGVQAFSQPGVAVYVFRLITHPFKALTQTVFPQSFIIDIANKFMSVAYPTLVSGSVPDPYIAQSIGADIVSYALSFLMLVFLFFIRKSLLFVLSLIFIVTSIIPLIVIPGRAGYISLFDGRHLYMTSVGVSVVLAILITTMIQKFQSLRFIIISILGVYLIFSIRSISADLRIQVATANTRKTILEKIIAWYPRLPTQTVILTQSDKAFYGLAPEDTILPFQSGFGNTLLVWYDRHGDIFPACFFAQKFLYDLTSQGYRECEGRGFGYFRNVTNVQSLLTSHHLTREQIISYSYENDHDQFTDITEKIRATITQ